jgi:hypothetical protein
LNSTPSNDAVAQRSTSISGLLAEQIESLVGNAEAYERSHRAALNLLERGFHSDGSITASRNKLHYAKAFIDTNVLIYAHDVDTAAKHDIARRVLENSGANEPGPSPHKYSKSST